jgi:hypothetical protein
MASMGSGSATLLGMGDLLQPIRGGNGSNAAAIDARTHRDA